MLIYIGSPTLVEYGTDEKPIRKNTDHSLVTDATVTFALKTLAGVTVTNGTGSCTYVSGSEAKYQGTLASNVSVSDGAEYNLEITVSGSVTDSRVIQCLAQYRGER